MAALKVGVMGAGAVGCFVGGKLAGLGTSVAEVVFIGRDRLKREIDVAGLALEDLGSATVKVPPGNVVFDTDVKALADCDVVLCCVKSGATPEAAERMAEVLRPDAIVVSFQNGVRNPEELRKRMKQRVFAGIVNFNVLSKGHGVFRRATSGPLVIEAGDNPFAATLERALVSAGLEVERVAQILELQWAKLLINLNNSVSALSDRPTKELVLSSGYRRVLSALMVESLGVLRKAGIKPAKLGALPVPVIAMVLRLPTPLVRLVARAQLKIDPEARSSMWEDLTTGRPTEVDWINGEVVRLADACGGTAPLNRRLVAIVHEAEQAKAGSPKLSARDLWSQLHA